ncbi:MAG: transglycosylase SLT domain-containing protein [Lewinella sp.]|jgi:membrane-bound lytic murein transglycosylase D|uniref:lytic transglycosylase domain-containing protein n=1 Tax=Lewinella sp. TaxID=2004506 RepID=UPI003D6AB55E
MKFPWTILVTALLFAAVVTGNTTSYPKATEKSPYAFTRLSDELMNERIDQMDLPFAAQNTPQIKSVIRRFTVEGQRDSEYILGRAKIYFPIFEHYLRLYKLPETLKYLPIIESSLRPSVTSPVGAAGLWQFVASTGRIYGLTVNGQVDERLDPHKATEAAVRMLATLYEQFEDWGLVLAAYNCGPGRVRKAMRAANSSDYWVVRPYLPSESQHYVPRFIAAAYLMNYHAAHGITPRMPDYDMLDTRTFKVTRALHLGTLARQLELSYRTLTSLNPSYLQGLVAASAKGQYITVPTRVAASFKERYIDTNAVAIPANHQKSEYTTVSGDKLETLAILFQCTPQELINWNGLINNKITVNQPLTVYLPRRVAKP